MHESFMREAIALALESVRSGAGGPFGAVVVRAGQIVSRGNNQVTARNDPTAHAEIVALRLAGEALRTFHLQGCVLYTSCEPCPMCLAASYWAHVDHVYYASSRADAAAAGFSDAHIYDEISSPVEKRRLPMTQLLPTEAGAPFAAWQSTPGRISY